jgi:hypothetical protein
MTTLLISWLAFPLVLGLVSLGCGLLLEEVAATKLPGLLLLPAGFVLVSLAVQFPHLADATASLGTPTVLALSLLGYGLSFPWRGRRVHGWVVAAGTGVFAVFAAPVVASGRATFSGYIKLDDTATYLAMLDRAMGHAYNATGLAPSTYEATLNTSYVLGYPLGALLPLGIGAKLVGQDPAWCWQPYLTFLSVMIALGLYQLASGIVRSNALRAIVAFVGAQAALIYGYAMWGGIKELSTSYLIVLLACLAPSIVSGPQKIRRLIPLAAVTAAVPGALSVGGVAWLAPPLIGACALAIRSSGVKAALRSVAGFLVITLALAIPAILAAVKWLPASGGFTSGDEYGNLLGKLNWLQIFGVWPNGDFRSPPSNLDTTYVLVAVVALGAVIALYLASRMRDWAILFVSSAAALACVVYVAGGSPWIGGKTLASTSPIVLAIALIGAAAIFETGRRVEASVGAGVVIAAVLWSNVLQYHAVWLAPSTRLSELATIGKKYDGQGPTLMTDYEPYGVRHFLRNMDSEAASELRRHYDYLRTGGVAATGVSPDIDELQLSGVLYYRTLVLRRSGLASRPPSAYSLVWSGKTYQVWQRPVTPARTILEHLSLGSRFQPAAVPSCSAVLRLGRLAAANGGELATVERPPATVIEPNGTIGVPTSFGEYGEPSTAVYLKRRTTMTSSFVTTSPGVYGVWVAGTFAATLSATIDGRPVGSAHGDLNWPGTFTTLGSSELSAGTHSLVLTYSGPNWRPGTTDTPAFGLGPFAIAEGSDDRPVTYVPAADAQSLCGKSLDWVEALSAE